MLLDLYQTETAYIAQKQTVLLDEAGATLSRLEQNGILHATQVLVGNAIGKAKQLLKARGDQVPISATTVFRTWQGGSSPPRPIFRPGTPPSAFATGLCTTTWILI